VSDTSKELEERRALAAAAFQKNQAALREQKQRQQEMMQQQVKITDPIHSQAFRFCPCGSGPRATVP
jgi:hypothetical protein